MGKNTFDILILNARPASGKSEVIDYVTRTPLREREKRFHVGEFETIDDFPMLWAWFEEDAILSELGHPRLHTDAQRTFKWVYLWDVLIRRLCLDYRKKIGENPDYHDKTTTLIEFSRGGQHGGYRRAYEHLSREVAERAAILYINVSWEESLRKNQARFNPDRAYSILEHGISDEKIEFLYKECDWEQVSAGDPQFIAIQGVKVPYAVFENEDDVTTGRGDALGQRLEEVLVKLWEIYAAKKK
jgi:hypothetical protein